MKIGTVLLALLLFGVAWVQGAVPYIRAQTPAAPTHAPTGNPALDRAMTICDTHHQDTPYAAPCAIVEHEWQQTAAAKAEREAAKREEDDRVWLLGWVQTLNGKP
jgi:hypothetical protein